MEKTPEELEAMKREMLNQHQKTVSLAHEYFAALPLGSERIKAGEIYQQLRNATRL